MYLIMKWVFLGLLAFCCITSGQKSPLDKDGKLMKKSGLINGRIHKLKASVGEPNERPFGGMTRTFQHHQPLHGRRLGHHLSHHKSPINNSPWFRHNLKTFLSPFLPRTPNSTTLDFILPEFRGGPFCCHLTGYTGKLLTTI